MKKKTVQQIYDKILKRSVTLSNKAVINFINGTFGKKYPLNSTITYNWTENVSDELKRTIADGIMTINGTDTYHIEGQINEDEEMQFRMFEYGYQHALKVKNGQEVLRFPEPLIIYLYKHGRTPDVQSLLLDFGDQGMFEYKVNTYKLLAHSLEDLLKSKLFILLPFYMLKLREEIEKKRTKENMLALKELILTGIIGAIEAGVSAGDLTYADAGRLRNMVGELYNHIYAHYEEFEKEGINDMVEEGLVLEMDIIEYNHKKAMEAALKKKEREVTEKVTEKVLEDLVQKIYKNTQDIQKTAELVELSEGDVRKLLKL